MKSASAGSDVGRGIPCSRQSVDEAIPRLGVSANEAFPRSDSRGRCTSTPKRSVNISTSARGVENRLSRPEKHGCLHVRVK